MFKKLFSENRINWLQVILFAVALGLYTGVICLFPAIRETSLHDIAVSYEFWVFFAVIIVVKCKNNWEAALKCFLFFLISTPLCYAIQVLAGSLEMDKAIMYARNWMLPVFATLPGGFIAWYCKKQNTFGAVILGLGNTIIAVMALYYVGQFLHHMPHHIVTIILDIAMIIIMSVCIQKEKKNRIISLVIPAVLGVGIFVFNMFTGILF